MLLMGDANRITRQQQPRRRERTNGEPRKGNHGPRWSEKQSKQIRTASQLSGAKKGSWCERVFPINLNSSGMEVAPCHTPHWLLLPLLQLLPHLLAAHCYATHTPGNIARFPWSHTHHSTQKVGKVTNAGLPPRGDVGLKLMTQRLLNFLHENAMQPWHTQSLMVNPLCRCALECATFRITLASPVHLLHPGTLITSIFCISGSH